MSSQFVKWSWKIVVTTLFILSSYDVVSGKVLELSDRVIPLRYDGMWLVLFYAPWCAHCKKLEPIWKHVDQSLANVPLRIGRIDCSRFPTVAAEFNVQGFPTILFFKGDQTFTYEGDRTREDIVGFARRLLGAPVAQIRNRDDFEEATALSGEFFLFAGQEEGDLWEAYNNLASTFQQHEFFYRATAETAELFSLQKETQTVRVYKDNGSIRFEEPLDDEDKVGRQGRSLPVVVRRKDLNSTLVAWLHRERFPQFMKITRGKFSRLLSTKKLVVMVVLEENRIGRMTPEMEDFREMVKSVQEKNALKYRVHFQFGWTGSPDLANSVAMETLSLPNLLVINSTTYQHFLPNEEDLTPDAVEAFLDNILIGKAPVYGGATFTVRLYRAFYELKTSVMEMWRGNPALACVLFGLPCGFLALICYSICCADIMDAEDEDEEDEIASARKVGIYDWHEKTD